MPTIMTKAKTILAYLFLAQLGVCFSQSNTIVLSEPEKVYHADAQAEIFIDSTASFTVQSLIDSSNQHLFKPLGKSSLTFGYVKNPIWIRLALRNTSKAVDWYLEIPSPYLEEVDFYQSIAGRLKIYETGYYRPFSTRAIPHVSYAFPIHFDSTAQCYVYLRVAGQSPKNIPLRVLERQTFTQHASADDVWYGMFFGVLVVMLLYNLVLFVTLRDWNYLIYVGIIFCTLSIFGSASGYASRYVWPTMPHLNFYFGRLMLGLMAMSIALFSIRFLETKRYSKPMHYALLSIFPIAILAMLLVATNVMSAAANNLISVGIPIFLLSGVVCLIKGNKNAPYFVAAWTVYLAGGLSLTLRNSGVLPFNFWTTHLAEIGAACETFLTAMALSSRYTRLRKENEEAQAALINQLQENQLLQLKVTLELEGKVQERTREIKSQNEKLTQLNLLKDKLMSVMAHDIRSPLNQLASVLQLAENEMLTKAELKDLVPKIRKSILRNENFIGDLLIWAKSQIDGMQAKPQLMPLAPLVDDVVQLKAIKAAEKQIKLHVHLNNIQTVFADAEMFKSILRNLLSNAIKFTPVGGTVELTALADNDFIEISIRDNGQGIHVLDQKKLFSAQMYSTQGTADEKGTGLGLLICKDFVEQNGGAIWAESQLGIGSTFSFTVPKHEHAKQNKFASTQAER